MEDGEVVGMGMGDGDKVIRGLRLRDSRKLSSFYSDAN